MPKRSRYRPVSPGGTAVTRGQTLVLQGQPWTIIGWDDRRCFLLIHLDGAVCQIDRKMCFDLGYRWRPLTHS